MIVLTGQRPPLDGSEVRVLRAVCDQLALVLERDRLLRKATDAEILEQTETARRNVLAAVSHDLRSPLAAIKASVTDLLDPEVARSDADRGAVLLAVDHETDRLDALVANLLDMSRIEAGVLQARPETVDLADAVTGEVDAASVRWPGVRIEPSFSAGDTTARADPVLLLRVLSNLLDNAARAASRAGDGPVTVEVAPQGGRVAVRVVDHGAGLDAAARRQLFLPFARLDERETTRGPGLGLAIAKGFLDLMDGRAVAGGHARRRRDVRLLPAGGRMTRILVVDDEPQIRLAVERSLLARGYEVQVAGDGAEALDLAAAGLPDLVILDLNMPVMDGLECCRRLRTGRPCRSSCCRCAKTSRTRSRRSTWARTTT